MWFTRHYTSNPALAVLPSTVPLGLGWRSNYDRVLLVAPNGQQLRLIRADASTYTFNLQQDGTWLAPHGTPMSVQGISGGGWLFTTPFGDTERYDGNGRLLQLTNRNQVSQVLQYDKLGHLSSVSDTSGRTLNFAYGSNGLLQSVTAPGGAVYSFGYNARAALTAVTLPDGTARGYLYENAQFVGAMTGLIDEVGQRVASWTYDAKGRAVANTIGNAVASGALQFGQGQTVASMVLGATKSYQFTTLADGRQMTTNVAASCAGCNPITSQRRYDSNGYLLSLTNANGVTTTFTRDAQGRETSRTQATGTPQAVTTTTAWQAQGLRATDTSVGGIATHLDHDAVGNVLQKTVSGGGLTRTWQYAYNSAGQLVSTTGPKGEVTAYGYDALGNALFVTNPLGQTMVLGPRDANGRILSLTDANGVVTQFQYDLRGRLITSRRGDQTAHFTWTAFSRVASVTQPTGTVTQYGYDSAHRLVRLADSSGRQLQITRNAAGQRTLVQLFGADGSLARSQSASYDPFGRLATTTSGEGQVTRYSRDAVGRVVGVTDPLGRQSGVVRDALGRPSAIVDAMQNTVRMQYDALSQVLSVNDPRDVQTHYAYSGLGDLLQVASPDAGARGSLYDAAGLPQATSDALKQTTTYRFDRGYRITSLRYADGDGAIFTYDQGAFGIGRLTQIDDVSGSTGWRYDAQGHVVQQSAQVEEQRLVSGFQYDPAGRLTQMTYPSGSVVGYGYGGDNRVHLVSVNGQPAIQDITYDASGAATSWRYANGQTVVRSFDRAGRQVQNSLYSVRYDAGDRIVAMTPTAANVSPRDKQYAYDALDRLTGFFDGRQPLAYGYDANGNRASDELAGVADRYDVDPQSNRLLAIHTSNSGEFAFGYDANGSVTSRGGMLMTYDGSGRLSWIGPTHYMYNALGQRVAKLDLPKDDSDDNSFIDDRPFRGDLQRKRLFAYGLGGMMIGEYFGDGKRVQETVYFAGQPALVLAGHHERTRVFYVQADHLGTPRQISDGHQHVVWAWESTTFGSSLPDRQENDRDWHLSYHMRFAGQYFDAESGLFYNMNRYYDPQTGRYLQSDPLGLAAGINTYAYVRGNPVSRSDSMGLAPNTGSSWLDKLLSPYPTASCATGECAAGLLPSKTDDRTQAQIDYGQCKLVCNISAAPAVAACNVALAGGIPGAVSGNVAKMSVCSMVCKP